MMDAEMSVKDKVEKAEKVEVIAGKFSALFIISKQNLSGQEGEKRYWYAPNVGLVKSYTNFAGVENNSVLIKYNLKPKKK
jgi:hypothetical protein